MALAWQELAVRRMQLGRQAETVCAGEPGLLQRIVISWHGEEQLELQGLIKLKRELVS